MYRKALCLNIFFKSNLIKFKKILNAAKFHLKVHAFMIDVTLFKGMSLNFRARFMSY